jgi:branched-chain amino acid transport system substrate-binding protein
MKRLHALLITLAICLASSAAAHAAPAAGAPVEIYAMLPLSGSGAFSGKSNQNALIALQNLANKQGGIKGRPVKFTFLDDQSSASTAVELTNQLVTKNVQWMLGPGVVASCRATEPILKAGPVQYCQSPAVHPAKDSYLFSGSVSSQDLIIALVRYARNRGWNRLAFITPTDASGQDGDQAIDAALAMPENKDMTLVRREHFNGTDVAVTAQIANIKAANPQAVFLWAPNAPFGTLLRGVSDAGLDVPMITTDGNMTYGQIKQYASFMPKEIYFPGLTYMLPDAAPPGKAGQPQRDFRAAMTSLGFPADLQSGFLWDAGQILIDALRTLGPTATSAQVHSYIENLHDFIGIAGPYDFRGGNQRGLTSENLVVMRWDAAKSDWVPVSKAGGKVGK